jgi:hypothetical protein
MEEEESGEEPLRKRVAVWLRRKGDSGSSEVVREIIENVTGVFKILQEWETENRPDDSDGRPVRRP